MSARAAIGSQKSATVVAVAPLDVDQAGVALGAIADEVVRPEPGEIDADRDAVADIGLGVVGQPLLVVQGAQAPRRRACAWPRRKRICDSREPSRTSTGNVFGLISA